jgi:hypothetical protein
MFGPRSEEVKAGWRNPHELNDLFSPDLVHVMKLRRIRWAVLVAHMGERRGLYMVSLGKQNESDHLEDWGR